MREPQFLARYHTAEIPVYMKTYKLSALLLIAVSPIALYASSDTDQKIEDAAKSSYNYRTVLEGKVDVRADDGVVTLTGKVPDREQRSLAEDTVDNLPGVLSVVNEIQIVPPAPEHSDPWIAFEIRSILLVKAHVSAASTAVSVVNGEVTLTGTADTTAQKELTEVYAKEVEGVKSVKNDIVVEESPQKQETVGENIDDVSITGQIKYALLSHQSTSALNTKVVTENGVVTLTGEADSDVERTLVTQLAQSVRGVTSVDNRMTVKN